MQKLKVPTSTHSWSAVQIRNSLVCILQVTATTCFQFSYQYWIKDGQDWIVRKYQTESKQSVQHLLTRKQKLHGKTSSHSFMNMVQQVLSDISQTLQL